MNQILFFLSLIYVVYSMSNENKNKCYSHYIKYVQDIQNKNGNCRF